MGAFTAWAHCSVLSRRLLSLFSERTLPRRRVRLGREEHLVILRWSAWIPCTLSISEQFAQSLKNSSFIFQKKPPLLAESPLVSAFACCSFFFRRELSRRI